MGQIRVEKNVGGIEGLCVITPAVHGDARGYFMETYSERDMREAGIDIRFVQDNIQRMSGQPYTLDGGSTEKRALSLIKRLEALYALEVMEE